VLRYRFGQLLSAQTSFSPKVSTMRSENPVLFV
jgi:hypothetical protein